MALTICYTVGNKLYLNITNRCPCNCTFCIRHNGDGAYGSDSLWLEHEPTIEEIINDIAKYDLDSYEQIVFCGYGEPTERIDDLIKIARYLKTITKTELRINTNGLSDLINKRPTAEMFRGCMDIISISLNAGDEETYNRVTRPALKGAFEALKRFALECKDIVPQVMFTVVDVITEEEIAKAQQTADSLGIHLRVREYDD